MGEIRYNLGLYVGDTAVLARWNPTIPPPGFGILTLGNLVTVVGGYLLQMRLPGCDVGWKMGDSADN